MKTERNHRTRGQEIKGTNVKGKEKQNEIHRKRRAKNSRG